MNRTGSIRTVPPSRQPDDSLALLAKEDRLLIEILDGWASTTPSADVRDSRVIVRSAFKRGTYGELLIEHTAVRLAAITDVARVLADTGARALAEDLVRNVSEVRHILDRLDELTRGVDAMGVAASVPFAGAAGQLAALIRADLRTEPIKTIPQIASALGENRVQLRSARWIHRHAPTHPAPHKRWYDDIAGLVRIKAAYDRLRGFPWARSAPLADPKIADAVENEP
jgi:hypothetical protein